MKRILTFFVLTNCLSFMALDAQSLDFSLGELNPYFTEYINPLTTGLAAGMSHGWANDAGTHKTLGFDVSFSVAAAAVPSSAMTFSVSKLDAMKADGYQFLSTDAGNPALADDHQLPTLFSSQEANAILQKKLGNKDMNLACDFNMLNGIVEEKFAYVPNVALQLAFGLPKGTDVIVRFIPEVENMNQWGVGLKHDIKQWIPVINKVPLLDISALLSYSRFNIDVALSGFPFQPANIITGRLIEYKDINGDGEAPKSEVDFKNAGFGMNMNNFMGSLLVGLNVPVVHPFVGVGFSTSSMNTGLTGALPLLRYDEGSNNVSADFDNEGLQMKSSQTNFNFQAGLSLKIFVFRLFAQYTYQDYSMYTAGVSLGFR